MADSEELTKNSIVRIFNPKTRRLVGTGFLISNRHLMTCAHVVNTALGRSKKSQQKPMSTDVIGIDFYVLLDPKIKIISEIIETKVMYWEPINYNGTGDIAVIEISLKTSMNNLRIPHFIIVEKSWAYKILVWGFSDNHRNGNCVGGTLRASQGNNLVRVESDTVYPIEEGFSGAPVWDDKEENIVGMIVEIDVNHDRSVRMIPTSVLKKAWNELVITDLSKNEKIDIRIRFSLATIILLVIGAVSYRIF